MWLPSGAMTFNTSVTHKGTIVRLKSGSPIMTSEGTCASPNKGEHRLWVQCSWFAGSTCKRQKFPPEALEIVPKEEASAALQARARRSGMKQ